MYAQCPVTHSTPGTKEACPQGAHNPVGREKLLKS